MALMSAVRGMSPELQDPLHAMTAPISADPMEQYERAMAAQPMAQDTTGLGGENEPGKVMRMAPVDPYEEALKAKQMADLRKDENPYGSPENHPGFFGKLLHGLSVATGGPNRRAASEAERAKEIQGIEKEKSAEQLQGAQAENAIATAAHTAAETPEIAPNAASLRNLQGATTEHLGAETEQIRNPQPNLATAYAHRVTEILAQGGDPSQDPIVQHIADAITDIQRQPAPRGFESKAIDVKGKPVMANFDPVKGKYYDPTSGAEIPNAIAYEKPPAVPGITVMVPGPNGTQTVQRLTPGQTITPGTQEVRAGLNAPRQDILAHDKAYVQPAETVEKSYQMMNDAYNEYENARRQGKTLPTGAQSMLALSTHLSTTFGNVKGARVTKDMIHEHLGARSIGDDALVAIQKLTNGDQLSPGQWTAFHDLIKQSRNLSWSTAVKEAARKHIPMDFLPPDLQQITKDGKVYQIGPDGQYHAAGGQ